MAANVIGLGDRFVALACVVGQTAAKPVLGDRYFLCGGDLRILIRNENERYKRNFKRVFGEKSKRK